MKPSAEYRAEGREALRGKWRTAIVAGFVAILFGVGSANTFNNVIRFRNNYTMHAAVDTRYDPVVAQIMVSPGGELSKEQKESIEKLVSEAFPDCRIEYYTTGW